jgi:hypothetical protein
MWNDVIGRARPAAPRGHERSEDARAFFGSPRRRFGSRRISGGGGGSRRRRAEKKPRRAHSAAVVPFLATAPPHLRDRRGRRAFQRNLYFLRLRWLARRCVCCLFRRGTHPPASCPFRLTPLKKEDGQQKRKSRGEDTGDRSRVPCCPCPPREAKAQQPVPARCPPRPRSGLRVRGGS